MNSPLVSCICPTYNRLEFLPRMLRCFQQQDWPNRELIVLDDGDDGTERLFEDNTDPMIRYHHEIPKQCNAIKRNRLCELAQGEYILHWDSDDWHSPARIRRQISPLIGDSNFKTSGTSRIYYYKHGQKKAYEYRGKKEIWLGGIAYAKAFWQEHRFDANPSPGEDTRWLRAHVPVGQRYDLADPALFICAIHASNDSRKNVQGNHWGEVPWEKVAAIDQA
jgi:glycosyltransferase involved in cell wall biosynthesis